jgi:hypothetical protein
MAELQPGELDPSQQTIAAFIGRKHSGKSKLMRHMAASYPYDQVQVDLHGDDRPAEINVKDSGVIEVSEIPPRWPEHQRPDDGRPMTVYYQPDAGSPTLIQDMDAASGLAWSRGRCLLVVHEWGALALAHNQRDRPMTSRVLSQGRKRKVSLFLAMHRPYNIDTLTLTQADLVFVFEVPRKEDQERIATDIGWNVDDFKLALKELGPYEYLCFDRRIPPAAEGEQDYRLTSWAPLSAEELAEVMRGPAPALD